MNLAKRRPWLLPRGLLKQRLMVPTGAADSRTGITWTTLLQNNSAHASGTFTTASVTPVADRPIFIAFMGGSHTANAIDPLSVAGNGLTWTKVFFNNVNSNSYHYGCYMATGAAPTAGGVTVTYSTESGNVEESSWVVFQAAGAAASGLIVQTGANQGGGGTTATSTLAAFGDALNHHVAVTALVTTGSAVVNKDADFTRIGTATSASRTRVAVDYAVNDPVNTGTWASLNYGLRTFEVKAA